MFRSVANSFGYQVGISCVNTEHRTLNQHRWELIQMGMGNGCRASSVSHIFNNMSLTLQKVICVFIAFQWLNALTISKRNLIFHWSSAIIHRSMLMVNRCQQLLNERTRSYWVRALNVNHKTFCSLQVYFSLNFLIWIGSIAAFSITLQKDIRLTNIMLMLLLLMAFSPKQLTKVHSS